jgi:hypothetical protein
MVTWFRKLHVGAWSILFHTLATLMVAVVISLPSMNWATLNMLVESYTTQGFELNWLRIALHLGLAACLWALIVICYMWVQQRRAEKKDVTRLVKQAKGTVVTEFLIVFTPFILLTSGLAQLAMLNVTGLLADLAAFESARVVWVWAAEVDQPRYKSNYGQEQIKDRARCMASMALAPTAPNDFYLGRSVAPGSTNYYRRQRAWVVGAFMPDATPPSWNYEWSGGQTALTGGGAYDINLRSSGSAPQNLTLLSAFDKHGFKWRAARKMTQAEWGLYWDFDTICPTQCDEVNANESGVHFEYWYNLIFPWFGYIWGEHEVIGMREGYYAKIERRHTFPAQPMP